eukprot:INCI14347.1.p4 GENE.INCI14347.1~~INCI14347.1.p4  ORF type:complete len:103 (+),score=1.14 INCI14347.1:370-678(+)
MLRVWCAQHYEFFLAETENLSPAKHVHIFTNSRTPFRTQNGLIETLLSVFCAQIRACDSQIGLGTMCILYVALEENKKPGKDIYARPHSATPEWRFQPKTAC